MINRTEEEIMKNWPADWSEPLVSIRCITYNHESFIAQALDGFMMQETDFPFEVIVHDDASTDKTADVIREYERKYPRIIKAIYETENQYSKKDGSLARIVDSACTGKYIAFCEGDDYWIDSLKLQKQVDFLEKNPDYGFSYTEKKMFNQERQEFLESYSRGYSGYMYEPEIKGGAGIWTLTFLCRKELYLSRPKLSPQEYFCGDRLTFLHITLVSKGHFLPEVTAVYRVLKSSASHFTSKKAEAKFSYFHHKTFLYYIQNGPKFNGMAHYKKKYSIRLLPYCLYYHDWVALKKIEISLFPIKYETWSKTIKYLVVLFMYKLCKIKPCFEISCSLLTLFGKK